MPSSTRPDPAPDRPAAAPVAGATTARAGRVHRHWWYLLLLLPFIGLLWLPWYARSGPQLWGFPFFYWYQFAWVLVGSALTGLVYVLTTASDEPPPYPSEQQQPTDVPSEGVR